MIYPLIKIMQKELRISGLNTEDIDRAIGVAQSVFGVEWLEELAAKRKNMPNPLLQHPIIIGAASGSFTHLVELIELCTYLVSFKDAKELSTLIPSLKQESSYGDNLFQLAMAYRFKKIGFSTQLEPSILNNLLGDFCATRGDLRIMAECTALHKWGVQEEIRSVFMDCLERLKKIYNKSSKYFVLDIESKRNLSFKNIQPLRDHITRAGSEFLKTGKNTEIDDDLYRVSIYEMSDDIKRRIETNSQAFYKELGDQGWDQILGFRIGIARIPGDVTSVDFGNMPSEALMRYKSLISPEDEFIYSLEDKLDKKVDGKLRQLRSHPEDHMSLLFIEVEDKLDGLNSKRIHKRLVNNVFNKVTSLNGIFITKRIWTEKLTHQYQGTFFVNPQNPLDESIFDEINQTERGLNSVSEWQSLFN